MAIGFADVRRIGELEDKIKQMERSLKETKIQLQLKVRSSIVERLYWIFFEKEAENRVLLHERNTQMQERSVRSMGQNPHLTTTASPRLHLGSPPRGLTTSLVQLQMAMRENQQLVSDICRVVGTQAVDLSITPR